MTETKTKKTATNTAEHFDVRGMGRIWAEQTERWLDEVERMSRSSMEQMDKMTSEAAKLQESQVEIAERMLEVTLENARRVARTFS
jgi:hypothetical protein